MSFELSDLEHQVLLGLSNTKTQNLEQLALKLNIPSRLLSQTLNNLVKSTQMVIETTPDTFRLKHAFVPVQPKELLGPLQQMGFKELYCFDCIDSSSTFLKQSHLKETPILCHTNMQTEGRGRQGKIWHSEFGSNLYFSLKYKLQVAINQCGGLSLIIGLALIDAIESMLGQQDIKLKWPNDLWWHDKKLSGILVELFDKHLVIGIGMNVNSIPLPSTPIDKPWTSIREIYQQDIDRQELLIHCIKYIQDYLKLFFEKGLSAFEGKWTNVDALKFKTVRILTGKQDIEGTVMGISPLGNLLVLDRNQKRQEIYSGEITITGVDANYS